MEMVGIPIWVVWKNFIIARTTTQKEMIMLSLVKGIRFDMTIFFPWLPCVFVCCSGLIFLFLVLAIISERIREAPDIKATLARGNELYSLSVPI